MAAPNYEQIQSFGHVKDQLHEAAIDEFMEYVHPAMTREEVIDIAVTLSQKYAMLGAELGAQWYDLCTELAGIEAEPAVVNDVDVDGLHAKAGKTVDAASEETVRGTFDSFMQSVINNSIRMTGNANLWRDYERGLAGGRWARVPVGDTCAWCLMLASQGAWYLTEKSALGEHADHYHDGCNCIAVYHADADSISGYGKLGEYKEMYYEADNMRQANYSGRTPYPEELQERIDAAKAAHVEKYDAGETDQKWTVYNEDLIVMRYKFGLK